MVNLVSCCLHPKADIEQVASTEAQQHTDGHSRPDTSSKHLQVQSLESSRKSSPSSGSDDEIDATVCAVPLKQQRSLHVTTELQLGRLSYATSGPSIFDLSRTSSPGLPVLSTTGSARVSSTNFPLSSPCAVDLLHVDPIAAAAVLSRSLSLRHTPTVLPPAVQTVLEQAHAVFIDNGNVEGLAEAASHFIAETEVAETFYIYDLGEVARLHATWMAAMPRVMPHYAVKCNPEPVVLAMLEALGAGFDCASIAELEAAAALGVPQSRIIFANPCKRPVDFRYASANGVERTTFDCPSELQKIARFNPRFKCVLRVRCDDETAKCNLGTKYGADMSEVPGLLQLAKDLGLQIVGVSFHVGSGCQNVNIYGDAISAARKVFDMAEAAGFPPLELLDIGGGFTAPCDEETSRLFRETASVINSSLDRWFPAGCGVRIISEPGRFFAETSVTRFSNIVGHRQTVDQLSEPLQQYWISDSNHGSFRIQVVVDGLEPTYLVLRSPLLPPVTSAASTATAAAAPTAAAVVAEGKDLGGHSPFESSCRASLGPGNNSPFGLFQTLLASRLMGISGKDNDKIHHAAQLPPLRVGDWLMFPYSGAYSVCSASNFCCGSFLRPPRFFVFSAEADKGWGDVLPQEATSMCIPPTIPEHAEILHDDEVGGAGEDDIGVIAAAVAAARLASCRSTSMGSRSQSMQRSLSRAPSKSRG